MARSVRFVPQGGALVEVTVRTRQSRLLYLAGRTSHRSNIVNGWPPWLTRSKPRPERSGARRGFRSLASKPFSNRTPTPSRTGPRSHRLPASTPPATRSATRYVKCTASFWRPSGTPPSSSRPETDPRNFHWDRFHPACRLSEPCHRRSRSSRRPSTRSEILPTSTRRTGRSLPSEQIYRSASFIQAPAEGPIRAPGPQNYSGSRSVKDEDRLVGRSAAEFTPGLFSLALALSLGSCPVEVGVMRPRSSSTSRHHLPIR